MKDQLRTMLITAKALQLCADVFAVFGVFLFAYVYFQHFQSNPLLAIRDPFFVVTVLIPFVPAAILAWLASRKRRAIRRIVEQNEKGT